MAGQFSSARKQVLDSLQRNGEALVNRHALAVLRASNGEVMQLGKSLGYATNALRDSGHVVRAGRSDDAYTLALSDAMFAREQNANKTKDPSLVKPLHRSDFLPPLQLEVLPATARAAVYYPVHYAMEMEMGYTRRGIMHPQAFFLMHAVNNQEAAFMEDAIKMLQMLEQIAAPPLKVPLSQDQKDFAARMREQRARDAQFRRESGSLSFAEMLQMSGETRGRGKGENFSEAAERIRNAAMAAWEGRDGRARGNKR